MILAERGLNQKLMLLEIILIIFPVSVITLAVAPFVVMISLSTPAEISHMLLGLSFAASCVAIAAAWKLSLVFWKEGKARLRETQAVYLVLASIGAIITIASCALALLGHANGFLIGAPMLIPFSHLLYEFSKGKE